jgi:hypothetical protein
MFSYALLRLRVPSPWAVVTAALLGIEILSLVAQIAGISGVAFQPALIAFWLSFFGVGFATLILQFRESAWSPIEKPTACSIIPLANSRRRAVGKFLGRSGRRQPQQGRVHLAHGRGGVGSRHDSDALPQRQLDRQLCFSLGAVAGPPVAAESGKTSLTVWSRFCNCVANSYASLR